MSDIPVIETFAGVDAWAEVSPFLHRPPREREKKVASPDAIVSSKAARSI